MSEPKILLFDIETAPSLGWYFDPYKEYNIIETERDWYMLSFAYKWLGKKGITVHDCAGKGGDGELVKTLWGVLDNADVVVAHNGDKFDLRKSNARFIAHGLVPPSPYKSVDTLKIARKHFKFDSNKLDDLGHYLGVGRKLPNTGKALWLGCVNDDPKAWKQMRRYNAQDVALLERVYLKLRAWSPNHPNLNYFTRTGGCPVCQSPDISKDGFYFIASGKKQRWECHGCGYRFVEGKIIKEDA